MDWFLLEAGFFLIGTSVIKLLGSLGMVKDEITFSLHCKVDCASDMWEQ